MSRPRYHIVPVNYTETEGEHLIFDEVTGDFVHTPKGELYFAPAANAQWISDKLNSNVVSDK